MHVAPCLGYSVDAVALDFIKNTSLVGQKEFVYNARTTA